MKDLLGMIPGVGSKVKDLDIDDDAFKGIESLIQSMTPEERQKPEILSGPRKQRIANGSGRSVTELNKLITQFNQMRQMMKMMNKGKGVPGKRR